MGRNLHFNFSHRFGGVVWNTVASSDNNILLIETRDHDQRQVCFSALDYVKNTFLWKDEKLEERWWINISALVKNLLLFTIYLETNNPDKKGILVYDLVTLKLKWWNNDFSLTAINEDQVLGYSMKLGTKEMVLDLLGGQEIPSSQTKSIVKENYKIVRPVKYEEGTGYFQTVKNFLHVKLNLIAISALEYLEFESLILISCYQQENTLVNYLLVLSNDGAVLLKEKLGEQLKGIGLDTFFILEGSVFFVKNKIELVSFKIV